MVDVYPTLNMNDLKIIIKIKRLLKFFKYKFIYFNWMLIIWENGIETYNIIYAMRLLEFI